MNIKQIFILTMLFIWMPVQACHTPARSAVLGKLYPDTDFAKMMHESHNQKYIGYKFKGSQSCANGTVDGFPCENVDLMGHLDLPSIGGGTGSDSWGWKHEASNRYFALVGRTNGTSFVEITDPANPVYIGNLPSEVNSSTWRDIKTYNNHAFIVADNIGDHGMQVFDLSQILDVKNKPATFKANTVYRGGDAKSGVFEDAHNIVINKDTGYAYLVGSNTCAGGLHIVNVNTPTSPTYAGCFDNDGYTHDAQCLTYQGPDVDYRNKEICFASNEDTVTVVDVSNKAIPTQLSKRGYTGSQYTHQGWLSNNQRYFLIDDELDEWRDGVNTRTYVMDYKDLENPVYKGFYESEGASIDHNQYVLGDHTYQANYSRGLRILELGDLGDAEMKEVAYFDTFPESDVTDFPGAWNVYPFFDNGLVIVSDINRGVFILKPNLPEVDLIFIDGLD